jgi:shikimate dehydrogenase
MGVHARYDAYPVENISDGMDILRDRPLEGMSVTIPHKVSIMDLLDGLDDSALETGAVNTVVRKETGFIGFNTDGTGAVRALEEKTGIQGKRVLLAGAGGSAKAIAQGIRSKKGRLWIANRDSEKGKALARMFEGEFISWESIPEIAPHIIINSTPVKPPIPPGALGKNVLVMDIKYGPRGSGLLKEAQSRGCEVIDGLRMLLYQGAEQFFLWTGSVPPMEIMESTLYDNLDTGA